MVKGGKRPGAGRPTGTGGEQPPILIRIAATGEEKAEILAWTTPRERTEVLLRLAREQKGTRMPKEPLWPTETVDDATAPPFELAEHDNNREYMSVIHALYRNPEEFDGRIDQIASEMGWRRETPTLSTEDGWQTLLSRPRREPASR